MNTPRRHEDGDMTRLIRTAMLALAVGVASLAVPAARAGCPTQPADQRGTISAERMGTHDANNIRTRFWNFGMVGDYPSNPANVDLSVFHSAEVPKGTGMNYTDGITPFVLERFHPHVPGGVEDTTQWNYLMETGYRERQAFDAQAHMMRFEPRPGFFQPDPAINVGRSPAISHDPRTWPACWPDKADDVSDPGWCGSWDGYFGKRPAADQESYTVMDDNFYLTAPIVADSVDATRRGFGLRVEVRGFQWSNPQAGNVIFWHYDITNESTTTWPDAIFGLYMDSGVGGSALSCDGVFESDDDNAYFDRSLGLNLVYTWDTYGHGVDLNGTCSRTGYLGYAYLETPGNPFDHVDNDRDGIIDEVRDGGPGTQIVGEDAIRAYVIANYDTTNFFATYGPLEKRPAYKAGIWWTGDEDMDWNPVTDDVGSDGVPNTNDLGEGDGIPTEGEPNFDRTDLHESDQIGLTGFKMNRIARGKGNTDPTPPDGITFANVDNVDWPQRLYTKFTDPTFAARFDSAAALNWNIAFLFASGSFRLEACRRERFSLALAYGATLPELRAAVHTVQQIYNANYQFAVPPKRPTVTAESGDGYVKLSWDDVAEHSIDPVTFVQDFEGYRIYRSTDPDFLDPKKVYNGQGTQPIGNGQPIAQLDLVDDRLGYSRLAVEGVQYWLGEDSGIRHVWKDSTVVNGQQYYYAVCAYDYGFDTGSDSTSFYPSENSIPVSRTPRGGLILPSNVVTVRPEPRVPGWQPATTSAVTHAQGAGLGSVAVQVVNSGEIPDGHLFALGFLAPPDSVRATSYWLRDSTSHVTFFETGTDRLAEGTGPVGGGLLPLVTIPGYPIVDAAHSGWRSGSSTNARLLINAGFAPTLDANLRRDGYPDDISIVFDDVNRDTGVAIPPVNATPAKFQVIAHTATGDQKLKFRFRDVSPTIDGTLSSTNDYIEVETYLLSDPGRTSPKPTWRFTLDPAFMTGLVKPRLGDVYDLKLLRPLAPGDLFTFTTGAQTVGSALALVDWSRKPYVVPNPYLGEASFEPQRYASSGRGDRRVDFRAVPANAVIRIYTVHGDLVQTLHQDGSTTGYVPWDLRTKDNLDVAPGLYIFHVEAPGLGTYLGKFAVVK
jgi:hypothetical protein